MVSDVAPQPASVTPLELGLCGFCSLLVLAVATVAVLLIIRKRQGRR